MNRKKVTKKITCISSRCFVADYDAGKYLIELASEHRQVTIDHLEI